MIAISLLNHASVLIDLGQTKLLIDPWFEGTCFEDGWGLRFDNDGAYDKAATATHLWISHFHGDHFHVPTLRRIAAMRPDMVVLGNHSNNFQLDTAAERLGFSNIVPVYERKALALGTAVTVTRYPTTGIDNMLLIETDEGRILNYNDCNLPPLARKLVGRKMGPVDIFMTNFNHAGKLLVYPPRSGAEIKARVKSSFVNNYQYFDTKYIFPFASHHYYRAPESAEQNDSMLRTSELLDIDARILDVDVGDTVMFDKAARTISIDKNPRPLAVRSTISRSEHVELERLRHAGTEYCGVLRKRFRLLWRLLPDLVIRITDLAVTVRLTARGIELANNVGAPHIQANSHALYNWFNKTYGTDSFVVGAHFTICANDKVPLKWHIVFGLLIDNKLDAMSLVGMLFSVSGLRFLWNRKEEIVGIITNRQLAADYHD